MKIIAIDDDEIVLAVLSEALGAFGMTEFELAESGEIGLSKLERADSQFDCVLLDIQMPGLDGIEVCRRLRSMARYRRTPIIMLTAMSERSYVERAFDAGATDYVTKPFDIMELQTRLRVAEQLNDQIKEMRQSQSSLNALNSQLTEEYKPPLSTPLEISDVRGFLGLTEFRNFITQLSRGSYYASSLVALRVQNVDLLYKRCSASEFTYLIEDVADAISAHMRGQGSFFTYVGDGIFVCFVNRVIAAISEDLFVDIEHTLEQLGSFYSDGQPRAINLLQGAVVNVGIFTGYGNDSIVDAAISGLEPDTSDTQRLKNLQKEPTAN